MVDPFTIEERGNGSGCVGASCRNILEVKQYFLKYRNA